MELICFFQDGFRSSIQAKMENSKKEYKNWEILIRKVIVAEEKTRGRPALQIKEVDQYCPQSHRANLRVNKYQHEKVKDHGHINDPHQQDTKPLS